MINKGCVVGILLLQMAQPFSKNTDFMLRFSILFLLIPILYSCAPGEKASLDLIPYPSRLEQRSGYYSIDSLQTVQNDTWSFVSFSINRALDKEEYKLEVKPSGIEIEAGSESGQFYGIQTLKQLLTRKGIPCLSIHDKPRFPYRGFHLDVSRHFFSKQEVFKLLDEMAYYKLNTFHFHLTDNGGWRIQIDKYPLLTRMGAFRTKCDWQEWWEASDKKYLPENMEGAYGGYYTKQDIREIVAYAAERHINIIPEIEFPAHSDAVFVGYPELCCTGKAYTSGEFCIGNEDTYTFLEDVLTEVLELFPSEMIHIGGDEARMKTWRECPKCQKLMKQENMSDVQELQNHLIRYAEKFLRSKGRRMIGWDEILKDTLDKTSVIMCYRGQSGALTAASKGYDAIMTPGAVVYFDWYQANPATQKKAMYGYSPLAKIYSFDPQPVDSSSLAYNELIIDEPVRYELPLLTPETMQHVIGVQGSTFTEYIATDKHLEYMVFPRLLAVAEMAWTPQANRDWNDFKRRVNRQIPKLKLRGIQSFTLSDEVDITYRITPQKGWVTVTFDTEIYPVEIRYTTDGSVPTSSSKLYTEPFCITAPTLIKAAVFKDGSIQGIITEQMISLDAEQIIPAKWLWHE